MADLTTQIIKLNATLEAMQQTLDELKRFAEAQAAELKALREAVNASKGRAGK